MGYIVQGDNSAAVQNVEGFVHLEVPVDRNPRTRHHLLGPQCEVVGVDFDEDIAMVAKMNEMLATCRFEHISLPRFGLSPDAALQQHPAQAEAPRLKRQDRHFSPYAFMIISSEGSMESHRPGMQNGLRALRRPF